MRSAPAGAAACWEQRNSACLPPPPQKFRHRAHSRCPLPLPPYRQAEEGTEAGLANGEPVKSTKKCLDERNQCASREKGKRSRAERRRRRARAASSPACTSARRRCAPQQPPASDCPRSGAWLAALRSGRSPPPPHAFPAFLPAFPGLPAFLVAFFSALTAASRSFFDGGGAASAAPSSSSSSLPSSSDESS